MMAGIKGDLPSLMFEFEDAKLGRIKVINITECRSSIAKIMTDTTYNYVITKNNQPVRAIINYGTFQEVKGTSGIRSTPSHKPPEPKTKLRGLIEVTESELKRQSVKTREKVLYKTEPGAPSSPIKPQPQRGVATELFHQPIEIKKEIPNMLNVGLSSLLATEGLELQERGVFGSGPSEISVSADELLPMPTMPDTDDLELDEGLGEGPLGGLHAEGAGSKDRESAGSDPEGPDPVGPDPGASYEETQEFEAHGDGAVEALLQTPDLREPASQEPESQESESQESELLDPKFQQSKKAEPSSASAPDDLTAEERDYFNRFKSLYSPPPLETSGSQVKNRPPSSTETSATDPLPTELSSSGAGPDATPFSLRPKGGYEPPSIQDLLKDLENQNLSHEEGRVETEMHSQQLNKK